MAQKLDTLLNYRYEVRSPETCTITDLAGIHLCTAVPGCVAEFFGDGHPVTLSSDLAVMRSIPGRPAQSRTLHLVDSDSASLELQADHVYRAGESTSLALNVSEPAADFICELSFSCGSIAAEFSSPAEWRWRGDDVADGAFVPAANKRYSVVLFSDGVLMRGLVRGETL
ncbi:MAG: hypothetical protein E7032_05520 [Akkermansiaceae bacterium]|nr:hypothetical protein [Akkermansiaceae bacterium]